MGRKILNTLLLLLLVLAVVWAILPREKVDVVVDFDSSEVGDDLDLHLAEVEAPFDDITPGVEKRIVWHGDRGQVTEEVIVYLHGFSATSEEIRPVPDKIAAALGANLLFWRLPGHGRGGDAMAEPTAGDWIESTAHALDVADRMGDRVTILSTSTGGTLAALAAVHPDMRDKFDSVVFVSPNFEIVNSASQILTWPGARYWISLVAGAERSFETRNAEHARYWTNSYPTVSVVPLAALVDHTRKLDFSGVTQPALFLFSDDDQVVSAAATREIAARWGGPGTVSPQVLSEGSDPFNHVLAGDIMSPGMTDTVVETILEWHRAN